MSLSGLAAAIRFLTRLPLPAPRADAPADLAAARAWFGVVGLLVGIIVAGVTVVGGIASAEIAGLAGLIAWVLVTGALHFDGLADVADALAASHRDPERFRAVLKDPHVGAFGVTALVLQALSKLTLLTHLADALPDEVILPAIALVPAWARWGAMVWSTMLPAAAPGLGAAIASRGGTLALAATAIALAAASLYAAPVLLIALVLAPLIALWWRHRLGGMTGDCHGASIEVMETLLLASLVIGAG